MENKIKTLAIICYSHSIELCLKIKKNTKNKLLMYLLYLICSPYIFLKWILESIYEYTIGKILVSKIILKEKNRKFTDELSVVAIVKNESLYIKEWINYYKTVGVTKFYIYDNESTDNLKECLKDYIESKLVIYIYFPGKNKQLAAYNDAIKNYKQNSRYMAFIDCDEFIVPTKNEKLTKTIDNIVSGIPNLGGIGINWALYGSSGLEKRVDKPITQVFLNRGQDFAWQNFHVKTICNPRLVKNYISPHFPIYRLGAWNIDSKGKRQYVWYNHDVDFSIIRCNHYFGKSREEFIQKRSRGMADRQSKYDLTKFDEYDLNDIHDDIMLRYADKLV
ncbi:MAG: glycosyltransferase family 92 protein [Intestinibacter bartlettii]|uniref:glycosyltransferase family 92 protein n=1 Tax=Intestinibacter bartlettii TaxID=261299 RepID=UPI0039A273EF